jgi:ubiquinone/menaquinone biosynthesis C-methylase UbiE
MAEADVEFPLVHASAEATQFDDASFDIVYVSLYVPSLTASEW